MSFEHVAGHNSASACLDLRDLITELYAPQVAREIYHSPASVDVEGAKRAVAKFIAQGLITVAKPIADYARYEKRKHQITREQREALTRAQTLAAIRDEQKLDRVVSMCRNMDLKHGELPRIAAKEGVDYRRLLNRVRGKTKTSRLT